MISPRILQTQTQLTIFGPYAKVDRTVDG